MNNEELSLIEEEEPNIDHLILEALKNVKALSGDLYLWTIEPGMKHNTFVRISEHLRNKFKETGIKAPIIIIPSYTDLVGYHDFDFHVAFELLKAGYKVQRANWDGYLYMTAGIIYHRNSHKAWQPTQAEIFATNWRLF